MCSSDLLARKFVVLGIEPLVVALGCQPDQRPGNKDGSKQYPQQRWTAHNGLDRMPRHLQLHLCEQAEVNHSSVDTWGVPMQDEAQSYARQ